MLLQGKAYFEEEEVVGRKHKPYRQRALWGQRLVSFPPEVFRKGCLEDVGVELVLKDQETLER